jgi:hypothetical protein
MDERAGGAPLWPIVPAAGSRPATSPALRSRPPAIVVGGSDGEFDQLITRVTDLVARRPRVWVLATHLPGADRGELPRSLPGATLAEVDTRPGIALYLYARR